ncbi:MAG: type II toxin-antitoxin system RelE/ParE family toxin [Candidatus Spyradenecus sp.]
MSYEVRLSEKAEIHLEGIYRWVLVNHPASAKKVKDRLVDSMKSLALFPHRGAPYKRTAYRFLVSGKFKIVYAVDGETVTILAIE